MKISEKTTQEKKIQEDADEPTMIFFPNLNHKTQFNITKLKQIKST